ncbi:MAG: hypothetical protein AB8F95_18930 [Bacteroidia bacterium]
MKKLLAFLLVCLLGTTAVLAQDDESLNSIGLRFSTDLNYFHRPSEFQLVDHWFSTAVFGVFYRNWQRGVGVEFGLNLNIKGNGDRAFNLPVIMQDFIPNNLDPIVGMTALELDLKAGPRYKSLHIKPVGAILGYRLYRDGFLEPGSELEINRMYFKWPFGASMAFETDWGSVGFGAYYELEITNVVRNTMDSPGSFLDGGRQHAINLEITVTYNSKQY